MPKLLLSSFNNANTQRLWSYEGDIKPLPSGRNNHYFLDDGRQTIETSKRSPNFFNFQSMSILSICTGNRRQETVNIVLNNTTGASFLEFNRYEDTV